MIEEEPEDILTEVFEVDSVGVSDLTVSLLFSSVDESLGKFPSTFPSPSVFGSMDIKSSLDLPLDCVSWDGNGSNSD